MPRIQSAKKALRQNITRWKRNTVKIKAYKEEIKKFRRFIDSGKTDDTHERLSRVYKALDKAAQAGVIKKNKANRLKSRLTHLKTKSSRASS